MTVLIGLTGSIGMGKSTTAAMFAANAVPVFDADATVHKLYSGAAVAPVAAAFPGVVVDGVIDRARLSAQVLGQPEAMRRLESIVHPLVQQAEIDFIRQCLSARHPQAVLDIPLLLEAKANGRRCDCIAVVTAPYDQQRARVLARTGMTEARFEAILSRQMPDAQKRRQAHAVIDTGRGHLEAEHQVAALLRALAGRQGQVAFDRVSLERKSTDA